jgi:hypothetical protein
VPVAASVQILRGVENLLSAFGTGVEATAAATS